MSRSVELYRLPSELAETMDVVVEQDPEGHLWLRLDHHGNGTSESARMTLDGLVKLRVGLGHVIRLQREVAVMLGDAKVDRAVLDAAEGFVQSWEAAGEVPNATELPEERRLYDAQLVRRARLAVKGETP